MMMATFNVKVPDNFLRIDHLPPRSLRMARTRHGESENRAGTFFLATLLLWLVSVLFEIAFNERRELLFILAGCCFYQTANWVVRSCVSRDALFVNTSVSLLHSTITSSSVHPLRKSIRTFEEVPLRYPGHERESAPLKSILVRILLNKDAPS